MPESEGGRRPHSTIRASWALPHPSSLRRRRVVGQVEIMEDVAGAVVDVLGASKPPHVADLTGHTAQALRTSIRNNH